MCACRIALPPHLQLDSLTCRCPDQTVLLGLDRAMAQCKSIHIAGQRIHMLLHVRCRCHLESTSNRRPSLLPSLLPGRSADHPVCCFQVEQSLHGADPAHALLQAFHRHPRVQLLVLVAPSFGVTMKAPGTGPELDGRQSRRFSPLHPAKVVAAAAASSEMVAELVETRAAVHAYSIAPPCPALSLLLKKHSSHCKAGGC